jgi:hypothetical protein
MFPCLSLLPLTPLSHTTTPPPQCSQCVPGVSYRYPFASEGACIACPSSPAGVLTGYLVASTAIATLLFCLQHLGLPLTPVSLLVEFLQLLSLLGMLAVDWPSWFSHGLFPLASAASLNLDLGALGCVAVPGGQWGRWGLSLLLPVAVVGALFALHGLAAAVENVLVW